MATTAEKVVYSFLGVGALLVLFYCSYYKSLQSEHVIDREIDLASQEYDRELALRRQLVDLIMQKEHLISEANRTEDLEQNAILRSEIEELEQEILRVQSQFAEEIGIELRSRHNEVLRSSSRNQRISEGINALSERLYGTNSPRDAYGFPISQEEHSREYILLNIIHKKIIFKENNSSSSDDIDEEAAQNKGDIILPTATGGDVKDNLVSSTSMRNMCIICCDDYEENDNIAYSRNQECHHFYHVECILEWLVRDNNNDCPLCRSAFLVD